MMNKAKIIKAHKNCLNSDRRCKECSYFDGNCTIELSKDTLALLEEQEKEMKALRLLVEWATECDFGFDQFRDEYEQYKDEIKDMKYVDGMIHVAKRTLEDHGEFEKGM